MNNEITTQQYDYLKDGFLKQRRLVYRINSNTGRYYYTLDGGLKIYASGTTLISDGLVVSKASKTALEQYRVKSMMMGVSPDEYMRYRGNYGTIMHVLYGDFLKGEKISVRALHSYVRRMNVPSVPKAVKEQIIQFNMKELQSDFLSFVQWVKDFNVKPLAIEIMIASDKDMGATAIDLIADIDVEVDGYFGEVYKTSNKVKGITKGDPKLSKGSKTIRVIVDFKSGKKGFYESHEAQLHLNKRWVEENYPDIKIDAVYNFSPKDWRTAPTYNFKDQTNSKIVKKLPSIIEQARITHAEKKKVVKRFVGSVSMTDDFNHEDFYINIPLEEYITKFKDEVRDVVGEIVEDEYLHGETELKRFFNTWLAKDLKQLALQSGIPYKTKPTFITTICNKYKNFLKD